MYKANVTQALYERPDSGFYAVMFALQVCQHVHLYGMSNWRLGSSATRYRYYTEAPDLQKGEGKVRPLHACSPRATRALTRAFLVLRVQARAFTFTREVLRAMAVWPGSDVRGRLTLHKG